MLFVLYENESFSVQFHLDFKRFLDFRDIGIRFAVPAMFGRSFGKIRPGKYILYVVFFFIQVYLEIPWTVIQYLTMCILTQVI